MALENITMTSMAFEAERKWGPTEHRLKVKARELAAALGHELRHFRPIVRRVDSVPGTAWIECRGWRARCARCLIAQAVILPWLWEHDGQGIGGTALKEHCRGKRIER